MTDLVPTDSGSYECRIMVRETVSISHTLLVSQSFSVQVDASICFFCYFVIVVVVVFDAVVVCETVSISNTLLVSQSLLKLLLFRYLCFCCFFGVAVSSSCDTVVLSVIPCCCVVVDYD